MKIWRRKSQVAASHSVARIEEDEITPAVSLRARQVSPMNELFSLPHFAFVIDRQTASR